jgi:hypothetical protein
MISTAKWTVISFLVLIGIAEAVLIRAAEMSTDRAWLVVLAIALGLFLQIAVASSQLFAFEGVEESADRGGVLVRRRFVSQSLLAIGIAVWNAVWLSQTFHIDGSSISILCLSMSQLPLCTRILTGRIERYDDEATWSVLTQFRVLDLLALMVVTACLFSFSQGIDWAAQLSNPALWLLVLIAFISGGCCHLAAAPSKLGQKIAAILFALGCAGCIAIYRLQLTTIRIETILFVVGCPLVSVFALEYLLWSCFYGFHRLPVWKKTGNAEAASA